MINFNRFGSIIRVSGKVIIQIIHHFKRIFQKICKNPVGYTVIGGVIAGIILLLIEKNYTKIIIPTQPDNKTKGIVIRQSNNTQDQLGKSENSKAKALQGKTHSPQPTSPENRTEMDNIEKHSIKLNKSEIEEITSSVKRHYNNFNRSINEDIAEEDKIAKIYSQFFIIPESQTLESYNKFKIFMKSIVDREVTFKFNKVLNLSTSSDNKKILIEGIYTWKEQYSMSEPKIFKQELISEHNGEWKFYGWLGE